MRFGHLLTLTGSSSGVNFIRYLKCSYANKRPVLRLNTPPSWNNMASSNHDGVQPVHGQSRGFQRGGRGNWRGHGTGEGSSRGRGIKAGNGTSQSNPVQKKSNVRPTHFLALPLHNHPTLCSRVAAFQAALFGDAQSNGATAPRFSRKAIRTSPHVEGLDSSIVIDPVRMHMTLGVMALESEDDDTAASTSSVRGISPCQRRTVSTALALLASLSSQITQILNGEKGVKVPLEVLDVMKTEKMRTKVPRETENVGAGVLFLGPRESSRNNMDDERRKLMDVCQLINRTFRDAGYLTDLRPLKLHCTLLNASHRKPRGWFPFSYSDIRSNKRACDLIRSSELVAGSQIQTPAALVPPMPVNLGTWEVDEVQLWVMGSRDEDGRYVTCGGVRLSGESLL